MRWMPAAVPVTQEITLGITLAITLGACSSTPMGPDLKVYNGFPDCRFQPLGPVSGQDGQADDLSETTQGKRGSQRVALARMKEEAARLGADAVVIIEKEIREPFIIDTTRPRQPPRLIIFQGVAIKDC